MKKKPKVWENKSNQDTIGFGFASDCLTGWSDFFFKIDPKVNLSKSKEILYSFSNSTENC